MTAPPTDAWPAAARPTATRPTATRTTVGRTTSGPRPGVQVECHTLAAGPLRIEVLTYGAHLVGVWTPDRRGVVDNLVASLRDAHGRPDLPRYEDPIANPHLGATIGRYANRIGGARFELDGRGVQLSANEGPNQLHGGPVGVDRHVWRARSSCDDRSAQVTLEHTSPDGDQGFPGTVELRVRYEVDVDGHLRIDLEGHTDAPTVLGLTNHSYWNLGGTDGATTPHLGGHLLRVDASHVVAVDPSSIPTGELTPVAGTVFDLRRPTPVAGLLDDPRLAATNGMDHCLVFDRSGDSTGRAHEDVAVELLDPGSGRRLRLRTDQPGIQVYTSNHGSGDLAAHRTICLETQALPDSPNHPAFPSTVLRPGERYRHRHHLELSVDA